ncbi:MAG TPA: acetylornithine transaminase [Aeromicrobium sp.]|nr:acetylornithine transaminase [Aeromicrobium sp.]
MTSEELLTRYTVAMIAAYGRPQAALVRGAGARVWDADGNEYLDFLGGIAVNALGHAHPKLVDAVTTQLSTLGHVSNFFASEPQVALAERLLALAGHDGVHPAGGRVFFTNSGAEAVECAFKVTRRTGRTKIVAAEGSFHGRTMGALALTSKAQYREPFEPLPGEVVWVPYGDASALAEAVDDQTAAVILEPIQGEAGVVVPPKGYLADARRIATEQGALLWLDEIQSGIGRTGAWFDHHHVGVKPDLLTVAKGLGGGIPIGACLAFGPAADLIQPGQHGTTFGGNPVACAASLAVIETIESDGLLANATSMGDAIVEAFTSHPRVTEVTGRGLLRAVVLTEEIAPDVQKVALTKGLIVNAPRPDRLRMAPPLIITADDVAEAASILTAAIEEVTS